MLTQNKITDIKETKKPRGRPSLGDIMLTVKLNKPKNKKKHKRNGRPKGSKNKEIKYIIKCLNIRTNNWEHLGAFTSLTEASKKLNLLHTFLGDLSLGRHRSNGKFYKIIKLKQISKDYHELARKDVLTPDEINKILSI